MSFKIFPFYFPQLHTIPENDEWWGKDFTDWDLVKKASSYGAFQKQPRIPLDGVYCDQSDPAVIDRQARLALAYGISGFNFYHYWFDGKLLLERPVENLLANQNIPIEYFFTWANESWTRQWIGKPEDMLIKQIHQEDRNIWNAHYDYLRRHFLDKRYLKIENKPVFCIYRPELIKSLADWIEFVNNKAREDGFDGIHLIACRAYEISNQNVIYEKFSAILNFQPRFSINKYFKSNNKAIAWLEPRLRLLPEFFQLKLAKLRVSGGLKCFDYEDYLKVLDNVSDYACCDKVAYQVVFPDWDNGARYKDKATFFKNANIENFKVALRKVRDISLRRDDQIFFINAWNEWSEGAYLEPDESMGHQYLEAVRDVLVNNK
ncbi:glycosyltransferase WbsX family protein [Collimonas fungivorans]|uniref:Glycosyltransferase WbsX family protein n=1 Tax=Collimonas fungivorans TaxID=158899 RepID=A0A127P7S8_9BURK|nr:glycoside hydrolase family 99-like domain-containing protein [Collimonas fungivorans]AMO93793.1 glycosyltransferase WbsX family protein [Collimonas fungivorans]